MKKIIIVMFLLLVAVQSWALEDRDYFLNYIDFNVDGAESNSLIILEIEDANKKAVSVNGKIIPSLAEDFNTLLFNMSDSNSSYRILSGKKMDFNALDFENQQKSIDFEFFSESRSDEQMFCGFNLGHAGCRHVGARKTVYCSVNALILQDFSEFDFFEAEFFSSLSSYSIEPNRVHFSTSIVAVPYFTSRSSVELFSRTAKPSRKEERIRVSKQFGQKSILVEYGDTNSVFEVDWSEFSIKFSIKSQRLGRTTQEVYNFIEFVDGNFSKASRIELNNFEWKSFNSPPRIELFSPNRLVSSADNSDSFYLTISDADADDSVSLSLTISDNSQEIAQWSKKDSMPECTQQDSNIFTMNCFPEINLEEFDGNLVIQAKACDAQECTFLNEWFFLDNSPPDAVAWIDSNYLESECNAIIFFDANDYSPPISTSVSCNNITKQIAYDSNFFVRDECGCALGFNLIELFFADAFGNQSAKAVEFVFFDSTDFDEPIAHPETRGREPNFQSQGHRPLNGSMPFSAPEKIEEKMVFQEPDEENFSMIEAVVEKEIVPEINVFENQTRKISFQKNKDEKTEENPADDDFVFDWNLIREYFPIPLFAFISVLLLLFGKRKKGKKYKKKVFRIHSNGLSSE